MSWELPDTEEPELLVEEEPELLVADEPELRVEDEPELPEEEELLDEDLVWEEVVVLLDPEERLTEDELLTDEDDLSEDEFLTDVEPVEPLRLLSCDPLDTLELLLRRLLS